MPINSSPGRASEGNPYGVQSFAELMHNQAVRAVLQRTAASSLWFQRVVATL